MPIALCLPVFIYWSLLSHLAISRPHIDCFQPLTRPWFTSLVTAWGREAALFVLYCFNLLCVLSFHFHFLDSPGVSFFLYFFFPFSTFFLHEFPIDAWAVRMQECVLLGQ